MTFVTTRYRFTRPPTNRDREKLGRLGTVYGIRAISIDGDQLVVEYDASRMLEPEAFAAVRALGVPVTPLQPLYLKR